ncbi:dihydrodipicolinate synthase [Lactococcus chungangensis CAU 28 = DSM 22330]|jgi:4-hydroxy-tetrahydrodipicolinate synthase|uniref:4-hydroxy-tetrahydrodipicolinate synthase n=2 Tax=Pseudolactococcus chungangensis TaxID=451457 RepID=A0A1K2H8P2_9LACT|nr:dihydrodipicolinate synthase [Lactococcus chungangensis CAU 28 = DSM 22330]SFZ73199.1 4-hydroxy-tetrahydrodipicolinate synthase [Lactococcus chungangensis CAU 28 = DSM 22330]
MSPQNLNEVLAYEKKRAIMSLEQLKNAQIITALVTPFKANGEINFEVLPKLIEHLLAHHTQGIVLAGTTGESPTLTHDEELELFRVVQEIVAGRVPLIAGIGTNDTRDSVIFTQEVADFGGFAAGLAVVPYYNKPSQEGLFQHFTAIADASDLPIVLYNVPGRTVAQLTPETSLRLAQHPNIIAIKECTGVENLTYLIEQAPEDFLIYTGEDGLAFHAKALGAHGVISVAAHTNGDDFYEMFEQLEKGEIKASARIQRQLLPKIDALFSLPSPAPVKAVLNHQGFEVGPLRLPLVAATSEEASRIIEIVI